MLSSRHFRHKSTLTLVATLLLSSLATHSHAIDIPLLCANKSTYELRTSDVIKRCTEDEISLGEGALLPTSEPVNDLNPTLLARFKSAQAAADKEGIALKIVSGYRTLWVAPPEISHHPIGLAIDVNYPNEPAAAKWLEINGYKFGLCRTFKNEWWHFEGNIAPGWKCPKMLKDASALIGK